MKQLDVEIMGQRYLLSCPDDGEPALRAAVARVDAAMCKIRIAGKVKARDRIAVLACLNLAAELAQVQAAAATQQDAAASAADAAVTQLIERLDSALNRPA